MVMKEKIKNLLTTYLNAHFKADESQEPTHWGAKFVTYLQEEELILPGPTTYDKKDLRDPIRNWLKQALKSKTHIASTDTVPAP